MTRKPQAPSSKSMTDDAAAGLRAWRNAQFMRIAANLVFSAAAVTSFMLVMHHFGTRLPGCGPAAGCDQLQNSKLGTLPWIGWPVAFVGLAYFVGIHAAVAASRRGPLPLFVRIMAWAGAGASLAFVAVMVGSRTFCLYCALTHAFNLTAVGLLEVRRFMERGAGVAGDIGMRGTMNGKRGRGNLKSAVAFAVMFSLTTGVLAGVNSRHQAKAAAAAEKDRADSAAAIINKENTAVEQPTDRWGAGGFTGRYRKGPEQAAIRVVVLTDYQCPDCRRVEGEIEDVLKTRPDMSLSVKHFPMCVDCNKYAGRTLHPNACWAARAAEAAGILGGDEAFFKMHAWLFENKGAFIKPEDLAPGVTAAGLDPATFGAVMSSPQTLKNVQTDVEDGMALGLYSTPMVFINGVEFKGWQVPGAFKRTVDQVAAAKPAAKTSAEDRPVLAAQRFVDDWKTAPTLPSPADATAWSMGAKQGDAPAGMAMVEVIVYGDYQEEGTSKVNAQIIEAMTGRTNVRYTFRHYPVDPTCNTTLPPNLPPANIHPMACKAARAAEAAGELGGSEGYWKMHGWLLQNWKMLSDTTIAQAAKGFGWDAEKFAAAQASARTTAAIAEDCNAGKQIGLSRVPFVIVNGKPVLRPMRDGDNIMKRIIEDASKRP